MRKLREWILRFGGSFNKQRKDRELDEEIEGHLQMDIENNLRSGMTSEEARRQAMIKLGGVESTKEAYRDQRGLPVLEILWQDVRYGARQFRKSPGFTVVAVLTLALGIGSTTAIFSVVDTVLFRPLPYYQPGQLVQVCEAPQPGKRSSVSPGAFLDWKEHATIFKGLWVVDETERNLTGDGEPERLKGLAMSARGLEMLRVQPSLGRIFAPEEDQTGNEKVVVLTHGLWVRRFGADPSILGRSIQLSDQSYTIIGVLPQHSLLWQEAEFVIPFVMAPSEANQRSANWLHVMGRLKQGVSVDHAQVAMNVLAAQLKHLYPVHKKDWGVTVVPMKEQLTGNAKPTLLMLLGAVSLVLLIACANVANLLLAKASYRQKEMAIRSALGASRFRVIRQMQTETILLSVLGGTLGILSAFWSVWIISRLSGTSIPRAQEIGVDVRALGFALFASVATGFIMGLLPARQITGADLNETLREGLRASATVARSRVRSSIIAVEVALSFILLMGAGLLLNSFVRLSAVPPGLNSGNSLTMRISLPPKKYPNWERRAMFFEEVIERIGRLPGIEATGVAQTLPLAGYCPDTTFSFSDRPQPLQSIYGVDMDFCTPDYFRTVGIPLLGGRAFSKQDRIGRPGVAIINEAFAREHFPGEGAAGKRIHLEPNFGKLDAGWEIVGVVGNIRQHGLTEPAKPCVYRPLAFSFFGNGASLIIRSSRDPLALVKSVRQAVREVDPNQPVTEIQTLDRVVTNSVSQRRFILAVIGGFAGAALLLYTAS